MTRSDWPFHDTLSEERRRWQHAHIATVPFLELIGIRLEALETDFARIAVDHRHALVQTAGILHGGVAASLIDTAVAQAILTTLKDSYRMVTVHLDTRYFQPVPAGTVHAEGRVVRKGKRLVHGEVTVRNDASEIVAGGSCIYAVVAA